MNEATLALPRLAGRRTHVSLASDAAPRQLSVKWVVQGSKQARYRLWRVLRAIQRVIARLVRWVPGWATEIGLILVAGGALVLVWTGAVGLMLEHFAPCTGLWRLT